MLLVRGGKSSFATHSPERPTSDLSLTLLTWMLLSAGTLHGKLGGQERRRYQAGRFQHLLKTLRACWCHATERYEIVGKGHRVFATGTVAFNLQCDRIFFRSGLHLELGDLRGCHYDILILVFDDLDHMSLLLWKPYAKGVSNGQRCVAGNEVGYPVAPKPVVLLERLRRFRCPHELLERLGIEKS